MRRFIRTGCPVVSAVGVWVGGSALRSSSSPCRPLWAGDPAITRLRGALAW